MALIKCTECGHEVSDKASACPNCGCPIGKEHVCNECGALISSEDEFCPNCGNPIREDMGVSEAASSNVEPITPNEYPNKPTRKKLKTIWGIIALAAIVLSTIVGGLLFYMDSQEKERLEHEAMLKAKADSARVAELVAQAAAAEQAKLDSIKAVEEERQRREEEQRQLEEQEIGWLYGTWQSNIDGGAYLKISINASNLTEVMYIPSQGETKNIRSYYIDDDILCTDRTMYRIDRANKRLLGNDGTPFSRVSVSSNGTIANNGTYNRNSRINSNADSRIASLERKVQDDIDELNAMVSSRRMNPATMMYIKQNLPRELTELMEYYSNQGNTTKYNDYAYKKRVVLDVFRDLGM